MFLQNTLRYFGHFSPEGEAALAIRKGYNRIKAEYVASFVEIAGNENVREYKFTICNDEEPPEDRIGCVCGQFNDEGLMIQCERCQVWQHCDCVGTSGDEETFFCSDCSGKEPNLDIPMVPQPDFAHPGETYYVSLMRKSGLQLRIGDTVYVLRAPKGAEEDVTVSPKPKKSRGRKKKKLPDTDKKDDTPDSEKSPENVQDSLVTQGETKLSLSEEEPLTKSEVTESSVNDQATCDKVSEESQASLERLDKPPSTPKSGEADKPIEESNTIEKSKDNQFNHGGIPHKMMSPSKGPSIEASQMCKGNYPSFESVDPNVVSIDDMDIFRIERLWTNENGERFAFGHHYLRPHETFHEPRRKFFPNEVFRVPIHEVLPLDTIWRQCWVLDPMTFAKGRPRGCLEEHVYICEYRVDKTARLFNKISKPNYPICTKWFAFDSFDHKIKPSRTYTVCISLITLFFLSLTIL